MTDGRYILAIEKIALLEESDIETLKIIADSDNGCNCISCSSCPVKKLRKSMDYMVGCGTFAELFGLEVNTADDAYLIAEEIVRIYNEEVGFWLVY